MIETPQSILGERTARRRCRAWSRRRRAGCVGAHFGTYDYTALCGITASLAAHAASGLRLRQTHDAGRATRRRASSSRTALPTSCPSRRTAQPAERRAHRQSETAEPRGRASRLEDPLRRRAAFARQRVLPGLGPASGTAADTLRRASTHSSWSARPAATARLHNFVEKAAQATLVGDVFDDAATGQGLLNFFLRGINSGALTMEEALETGLTIEELQGRSFVKILENRRRSAKR